MNTLKQAMNGKYVWVRNTILAILIPLVVAGMISVATCVVTAVDADTAADIVHHEIPLNPLIQDVCEKAQDSITDRAVMHRDMEYIKKKLDIIEAQNVLILEKLD